MDSPPAPCRVYWGSHGCDHPRGHDGPHECLDCYDPNDIESYVGKPPYYGPETRFFGEDAARLQSTDPSLSPDQEEPRA